MTGRGLNLDSNLNSAARPTSCNGFVCSENPEYIVSSLKSFRSVEDAKLRQKQINYSNPQSQVTL